MHSFNFSFPSSLLICISLFFPFSIVSLINSFLFPFFSAFVYFSSFLCSFLTNFFLKHFSFLFVEKNSRESAYETFLKIAKLFFLFEKDRESTF